MSIKKAILIAHGHPDLKTGGGELAAYDLFSGIREQSGWQVLFLARTTLPVDERDRLVNYLGRDDEILWPSTDYDHFLLTKRDKLALTEHLLPLLERYRPDVVHVEHSDGLGLDLLPAIRRHRGDVSLIYTLHEFLPICRADGHMLKTEDGGLCQAASPLDCHRCFPTVPISDFARRERYVKDRLSYADLFLAPSRFLLERYVEWGISRDRIRLQENGCDLSPPTDVVDYEPPVGNLGFFGQLMRTKGLLVLMQAAERLVEAGKKGFHLTIHGANLENQESAFREELERRFDQAGSWLTLGGLYSRNEISERLREIAWVIMPSIWWENSPLVIQEAFAHRRPVICSNIGGMAEKVKDGKDGLHFRVADPASLAEVLDRAISSPKLWKDLRGGIRPVYSMTEAVCDHLAIYDELIAAAEGRRG